MDTQKTAMLDLNEFYAATMNQAGIDTVQDITKTAGPDGDIEFAAYCKQVYDQTLIDGIDYESAAVRLEDAKKIASAWLAHRAECVDEASKVAMAVRMVAEKAIAEFISEYGLDVSVDDAIKIAAFTHLPPFELDEEKDAAVAPVPGQPTADERVQAVMASAHQQNAGAGPMGYHPSSMHAALGQAMSPHLDPKAHGDHGEGIVERYVSKDHAREFYHHAGEIAHAASTNPNGHQQMTADQIFRHAKDRTEGVSDNKMLGFAQKNWKPLAAGGAALGVGAMYFLHKRNERKQREAYVSAARQRAGITSNAPAAQGTPQ